MQLFDVVNALKTRTLPKFLIFTGAEYAIIDLYLNQIQKTYNLTVQRIATVTSVVKKQRMISITGDNKLYVCRYDFDYPKQESEWSNVDGKLGTNYLVLILPSVDARSKFYKKFENRIVEFSEQSETTVRVMLQGKTRLSQNNLIRLIQGMRLNYSRTLLELDKIQVLSKVRGITEDEAFLELLRTGVIREDQTVKLQEFMESVMTRSDNCFSLYKTLIESGESDLTILAWLYNTVRNQLSVQTVNNPNQDTTGLSYFFIKECLGRKGYYSTRELLNLLAVLKYCEQGIKNGLMEQLNPIEYFLVSAL